MKYFKKQEDTQPEKYICKIPRIEDILYFDFPGNFISINPNNPGEKHNSY